MHRRGEGVEPSNTEAAYWYRLAATQNFPEAQQKLADLYYIGQGVPLGYTQAASWYRKAADQGNAEAQFQLGHLYATGQGVEPDYTQSRHWTREAALQGHEQATREPNRASIAIRKQGIRFGSTAKSLQLSESFTAIFRTRHETGD